jgi:hypothetical protein
MERLRWDLERRAAKARRSRAVHPAADPDSAAPAMAETETEAESGDLQLIR